MRWAYRIPGPHGLAGAWEVRKIKIYRNEWKYCCSMGELKVLESRLDAVMDRDEYGGEDGRYRIHSLYFDDYKDTCVKENDMGLSERVKYRVRYYNERSDMMRLERKEKLDGRCHKTSCSITEEELRQIMAGNASEVFWQTEKPLLKLFCVRCMTGLLAPRAVIDFERTAYVEKITNIRITVDRNISVADDFDHFADGEYIRYPLQEAGWHVLEVKFDHILPAHLKHIITERHLIQSSFSKYSLGRRKLQMMGRQSVDGAYTGVCVK